MSPNERKALAALVEHYSIDFGYFTFATIASESGLAPHLVRRTVRSLARKGFAEYAKGLWTEDGRLAGAGYRATEAGRNAIDPPAPPSPIGIAATPSD
jgi:Mn-dependent DtxR family transcriptional regulator